MLNRDDIIEKFMAEANRLPFSFRTGELITYLAYRGFPSLIDIPRKEYREVFDLEDTALLDTCMKGACEELLNTPLTTVAGNENMSFNLVVSYTMTEKGCSLQTCF